MTDETPDIVIVQSKITKYVLGVDDASIIVYSGNGDEVADFNSGQELQEWLTREGYVYFTGSRGIWLKAPKVPTKENVA